jgi:hypothetical protein
MGWDSDVHIFSLRLIGVMQALMANRRVGEKSAA